jgi:hypothetical protein
MNQIWSVTYKHFFLKRICHIKFHDKFHNPFSPSWTKNSSWNFTKKKLVHDWQDFFNFFIVNWIYIIESHDKSLGLTGLLFTYLSWTKLISLNSMNNFLVCHSQPFFPSQIFFFQFFFFFCKWCSTKWCA